MLVQRDLVVGSVHKRLFRRSADGKRAPYARCLSILLLQVTEARAATVARASVDIAGSGENGRP